MPLIDLSADLGPNTEPMMPQLDDDALPPGTTLGGCQILEPLSSDGMSILYLANDSALQRHVLIREHYPSTLVARAPGAQVQLKDGADPAARADALEAFLQEGRLLVRLDHPSIAKVHRFWEHNGTAYMMMPFYQGATLAAVLQGMDGPPGEAWLRQMLAPLLGALQTLHASECYHQALAPDSIWMTPEGQPMLLDLSACNQVVGEGRPGAADSVDRLYAPIEQFSHGSGFSVGPWTDLYAVAAVVHQALLGRPPTSAAILGPQDRLAPLAESLLAQSSRHAPMAYGPGFLAALDQALSVNPSDRPQSVAEFEAALNLAGEHSLPAVGVAAAATTATAPVAAAVLSQPGPDGRSEDEAADPAAAAAIAMAIASLPWVGKKDPAAEPDELSMHQVLLHEDEHRPHPKAPASSGQREPVFVLPSAAAVPAEEQMWIEPPRWAKPTPSAPPAARSAAARRSRGHWATIAVMVAGVASLAWYAHDNAPQWEQWVARLTQPASAPVQRAVVTAPAGAVALAEAAAPVAAAASALPPSVIATTPAAAADVVASVDKGKAPAAGTSSGTPVAPAAVASEATPDAATATKLGAGGPAVNESRQAATEARPAAAARQPVPAHRKSKPAAAGFDPESLPPTAAGPSTPRSTCGSRTNFALVYCMQTQCKRPVFAKHAQCVAFHRDGEVQ